MLVRSMGQTYSERSNVGSVLGGTSSTQHALMCIGLTAMSESGRVGFEGSVIVVLTNCPTAKRDM